MQRVAMVERPHGAAVTTLPGPSAHDYLQIFPKAVSSLSRCNRCHVGSCFGQGPVADGSVVFTTG